MIIYHFFIDFEWKSVHFKHRSFGLCRLELNNF
jgi:hypothetical protein